MKKSYVLDTNVLLQSPYAIYAFGDNDVILPNVVLEELDRFKKEPTENGANARQAARMLDSLREKGDLTKGVELPSGGRLRIDLNYKDVELPSGWPSEKADNRILKVCKGISDQGEKSMLVSKDIFERIKASIIGIPVQDFQNEQVVAPDDQYKGRTILYTTSKKMDDFYNKGSMNIKHLHFYHEELGQEQPFSLTANEFVLLKCQDNTKQSALGRFDGKQLVKLNFADERPFGIKPRNAGQRFMQEALMMGTDEAPLVIVKGEAGTAKTLFSLAVGLQKVMGKQYRKILVCRPNVKLDEDIGFLPGTETEKLAPFMRSVIDNLEILVDSDEAERYKNESELHDKIEELFARNIVTTEAIAYIRGRSIQNTWVIIDEAQNLTPKQVKGLVTRAGKGTKLVLIGDPDQIDHPYLDSRTNGLCFASERMKGSPYCCQVTMADDECERSQLAFDSAVRMKTF